MHGDSYRADIACTGILGLVRACGVCCGCSFGDAGTLPEGEAYSCHGCSDTAAADVLFLNLLNVLLFFSQAKWKSRIILLNSQMTDRFLSLFQRPNDINHGYRTDISGNNMAEDTYSVVWKLETQLIIKPKIIIQEESRGKVNE